MLLGVTEQKVRFRGGELRPRRPVESMRMTSSVRILLYISGRYSTVVHALAGFGCETHVIESRTKAFSDMLDQDVLG
jgi:phosphoenolpyruvate carboxylase